MLTLHHSDMILLPRLYPSLLQPQAVIPQMIVPTIDDHILPMYPSEVHQTNSKIRHVGEFYVVTY
jgi:hypothetical protein